jgi:hypothetical protein
VLLAAASSSPQVLSVLIPQASRPAQEAVLAHAALGGHGRQVRELLESLGPTPQRVTCAVNAAVRGGREAGVLRELLEGFSPTCEGEARGWDRRPPLVLVRQALLVAAREGDAARVGRLTALLLDGAAEEDCQQEEDCEGESADVWLERALCRAAAGQAAGHVTVVRLLLDLLLGRGVHLDSNSRDFALTTAVVYGRTDVVRLLLDRGVHAGATDTLREACKGCSQEIRGLLADLCPDGVDPITLDSNGGV